MVIRGRIDVLDIVRRTLAVDCACDERAFVEDGVTVVPFEEREGRRRFLLRAKPLTIVTMDTGVVVSCNEERVGWLRESLACLCRDDVFSAATIARLVQYVEPDGQSMSGPELKYVCTAADLRQLDPPDGIAIAIHENREIARLYQHTGFPNALTYRLDTPRPDVLATVATWGEQVVGIAGASADSDALWQIGIDVLPSFRERGIGHALVSRLAREVFRAGRVPYYSTAPSNVPSLALAHSVGFWPAWTELRAD